MLKKKDIDSGVMTNGLARYVYMRHQQKGDISHCGYFKIPCRLISALGAGPAYYLAYVINRADDGSHRKIHASDCEFARFTSANRSSAVIRWRRRLEALDVICANASSIRSDPVVDVRLDRIASLTGVPMCSSLDELSTALGAKHDDGKAARHIIIPAKLIGAYSPRMTAFLGFCDAMQQIQRASRPSMLRNGVLSVRLDYVAFHLGISAQTVRHLMRSRPIDSVVKRGKYYSIQVDWSSVVGRLCDKPTEFCR